MLQLIKSLKLSAMLPSTRAGQTGRDDDQAAAATGNSREEGWLMQVVRTLQLANPALTAEEAIVRAMGLVSISGQTPHGETEKIPKDVLSSIAHIKKLSDSNWHTWEPTFIDCLQRVHNAKKILYGIIAPGSEEYDEDLDKALVGLIHACCDNSPDVTGPAQRYQAVVLHSRNELDASETELVETQGHQPISLRMVGQ
ncbi:uncharacterized protein UDID_19425 [Ustilago sp. UG-2017a]|nr:uncharacterized protein UDID_19425 [Ustilago sp. UG-2017a]